MFNYDKNSLAQRMSSGGNPIYDDEVFRYVLLNHLPVLGGRPDTSHVRINQNEADQFYGDFYGLLKSMDVPIHLHWIATRLNGYTDSNDYDAINLDVYVPSDAEVDRIRNIHMTVHGNL